MASRLHRPRSGRARFSLALLWTAWMLVVQVLGGNTALLHAHDGLGGHLHLVASEVSGVEHEDWHRRAHGSEGELPDGSAGLSSGDSDLLLRFPSAPQLVGSEERSQTHAPRELAKIAMLTPCCDVLVGPASAVSPEPRARSLVLVRPRESFVLALRI
jgi:hypothetical protein